MAVTLKTLATKLELSTATVSRVLNDHKNAFISTQTRERVLSMARDLGYRPNRTAQALATGRTHTIGLLAYAVYPCIYSQFLARMQEIVGNDKYGLQIVETFNTINSRDQLISRISWSVDGIIAFDSPLYAQAIREINPSIPIVGMGTNVAKETDTVWIDIHAGTRDAVRHLLNVGCRRVAFLGSTLQIHNDGRGYSEVMNEARLSPEYILLPSNVHTRYRIDARTVIQEYIRKHGCPDGIFARTDEIAIGALRGLRDLGIRVPEQVALVGSDGIEDTEYHDPPISTVVIPIEQVCQKAWELLCHRMKDKTAPLQKLVVKSTLAIRESSRKNSHLSGRENLIPENPN